MASNEHNSEKLAKVFEDFLRAVGKSPGTHEEFMETPIRASSMWIEELLDGYDWKPEEILSGGTPVAGNRDIVIVRDLFFHSTCPHHLLPYHGIAHVAYIPTDRVVGLSKIARLVDCFAHRLIIQEDLGRFVAQALVDYLGAEGAACMLDTEQLCMIIRGVRKPGSRAVTLSFAGQMAENPDLRREFLLAIGRDNESSY
jgi:GTP cyclohydrolase I